MGTGATMIVKNQTNASFTTTLSNLTCMYANGDDGSQLQVFDSLQIAPYTNSDLVYIEANGSFPSCSFTQSHFQINYLGGSLGIDIGTEPNFDTAVTQNTNPAQLQAVLAPTRPAEPGPSYTFYLYGGNGFIPPYVNSVIQANQAALAAAVAQNPFVLGPASISSFNFSTLSCSYVGVVPGDPWQFSVILNATGTIDGTVVIENITTPIEVSVTDMVILVEGNVTISNSNPSKPDITVSLFACSIGNYSMNSALLDVLLAALAPYVPASVAEQFITPPDIAGIINDTGINQQIITALNNALKNI